MLTVENVEVHGWTAAIRGMRNPMDSWERMDSSETELGINDLDLMRRLIKNGPEHRKMLRMITVTLDITAPLYWWKEFDTYKIGTVANSCSTMHKLGSRDLTLDDFSTEHLFRNNLRVLESVITIINDYRTCARSDKEFWWQMIQMLPTSYNQRRTVQLNYEVIYNIVHQRKNHKLDEWHTLIDAFRELPHYKELFE